jgi:undecaprenyl-diphosphatase
LINELDDVDRAVYRAVAETPTPLLDGAMRRLSDAANYSRLSIASGAVLAVGGGRHGRRAAVSGLASVAVTATIVNVVIKPLSRRPRPDRASHDVHPDRHVRMPISRSFPSGHTAAAVAFASGAGREMPFVGAPLRGLAMLVGYSRVHTGVHYPGDVLGGALIGAVCADLTGIVLAERERRRSARRGELDDAADHQQQAHAG